MFSSMSFDKSVYLQQRNVMAQVVSGELKAVRTLHTLTYSPGAREMYPQLPRTWLGPVDLVAPNNVRKNDLVLDACQCAEMLGWHWFVAQN